MDDGGQTALGYALVVRLLRRENRSQRGSRDFLNRLPARYATDNLPNKVLVRDYLTALPDEKRLASEIAIARRQFDNRSPGQ